MISFDVGQYKIMLTAIEKFGRDAQTNIAMEECAELIQAISKYKRYVLSSPKNTKTPDIIKNLTKEIADVQIMIYQLQMMAGISNTEVQDQIDYKIQRFYEEHLKK
jgi:NTP pyrophosphatase (non-canonical NTP hydrolase)